MSTTDDEIVRTPPPADYRLFLIRCSECKLETSAGRGRIMAAGVIDMVGGSMNLGDIAARGMAARDSVESEGSPWWWNPERLDEPQRWWLPDDPWDQTDGGGEWFNSYSWFDHLRLNRYDLDTGDLVGRHGRSLAVRIAPEDRVAPGSTVKVECSRRHRFAIPAEWLRNMAHRQATATSYGIGQFDVTVPRRFVPRRPVAAPTR